MYSDYSVHSFADATLVRMGVMPSMENVREMQKAAAELEKRASVRAKAFNWLGSKMNSGWLLAKGEQHAGRAALKNIEKSRAGIEAANKQLAAKQTELAKFRQAEQATGGTTRYTRAQMEQLNQDIAALEGKISKGQSNIANAERGYQQYAHNSMASNPVDSYAHQRAMANRESIAEAVQRGNPNPNPTPNPTPQGNVQGNQLSQHNKVYDKSNMHLNPTPNPNPNPTPPPAQKGPDIDPNAPAGPSWWDKSKQWATDQWGTFKQQNYGEKIKQNWKPLAAGSAAVGATAFGLGRLSKPGGGSRTNVNYYGGGGVQ